VPAEKQEHQEADLAYKSQSSALKAASCVLTPYLKQKIVHHKSMEKGVTAVALISFQKN